MNKLDTLVILSPGFPANESDSTCVPPQQVFVKNLKQNFPNLHIIVLAFEYPFTSGEYHWHGIDVVAFGGNNRGGLFRIRNWVRIWLKLNQFHRQYKLVGLLNFWLGDCALIGSRFAKSKKLKYYSWILGQDAKAANQYVKYIRPAGNSLIALSDFITAEFKRNYKITPQHVIPTGVEPVMFGEPAKRDIDILGAGSLIPLKQYHRLLNIVYEIKEFFPGIKVTICGDGKERKPLEAMVKCLGLQKNVKLIGEISHNEVLELMQRTRVFVHTSVYEGFGVVCLEALHAGAQVVSFVKPMKATIPHWHIAKTYDDMIEIVKELLNDSNLYHCPITPYPVKDSTIAMMKLFGI